MKDGRQRVQGQGAADRGNRQVVTTCLISNDAKQVVGVGVVGVRLEHLAVKHLGLLQVAVFVMLPGKRELFQSSGHAVSSCTTPARRREAVA